MPKPIQLRIPSPCHENWANMDPTDKGRHCAACQKTVVDFTTMSDAEVIRYMTQAGPHVCGRLAPDQINRPLIPLAPPKQNRLPGWQILLAGIILTSDESVPRRPATTGIHYSMMLPKPDSTENFILGGISINSESKKYAASEQVLEEVTIKETKCSGVVKGELSLIRIDSVPEAIAPPPDTVHLPKEGSTHLQDEDYGMVGGIIAESIPVDTLKETLTDTFKKVIIDTLTALHLLPEKKFSIYPNPVPRGTTFHISWQTDPGTYQVSLFNISGVLISMRVIEVDSPAQKNDWELPPNLSAGVYILRAFRQGLTESYSRKMIVE